MMLTGGCHCRSIHYELDWPDAAAAIPARRCSCSYCTRFRGTWTSHPEAKLFIRTRNDQLPGRYRFGTETADFLFCSQCGVTVAALCESDRDLMAVLNINTLDPDESLVFETIDTDFGKESVEQRLARRTAGWIGNVILQ